MDLGETFTLEYGFEEQSIKSKPHNDKNDDAQMQR